MTLAERKPHESSAFLGVVVENLGRDRDHSHPFWECKAELNAVGASEGSDVGVHEIGSLRLVHVETGRLQAIAEQVAFRAHVIREALVVVVVKVEGNCGRVLERAAADKGKELLGGPDGGGR